MTRHANIGTQIAERRREAGLSQMGLADRAGLNLRTVERIEAGTHLPRRSTVQLIELVLDRELQEAA